MQVDKKDDMIVRQLIRDSRLSDNQISKNTGLPVKTVSRRRKRLEEAGMLTYMTRFCHFSNEDSNEGAVEMFIVTLRKGITKSAFTQKLKSFGGVPKFVTKHVRSTHVAEKDGQIQVIFFLESGKKEDLLEIMNADVFPFIDNLFGTRSVDSCVSYPIHKTIRMLHNYMPNGNIANGTIKKDWPDSMIFVR